MSKTLTSKELALCAALATISAVVQLMHFGYQSAQFGMWIDIVASSWIIAFFLFGTKGALITSFVGAIIITLFAPETWLGAIMKWSTTLPIWLSFGIWSWLTKKTAASYAKISNLIVPVLVGLILRSVIALPLNYYFAIPIWTGMTATKAIISVPWYIISGLNTIQGLLDVILAWLITYRFKLIRFTNWN